MTEKVDKHWSHGPHYQFSDSIVFITWRLAFTLPAHIRALFEALKTSANTEDQEHDLADLKYHNAYLFQLFQNYDQALGEYQSPGYSLNEPEIARIVTRAFHYLDGSKYELHAYCVMSNHVHLLLRALKNEHGECFLISNIVQSLKRWTANAINARMGKQGQVWDDFYFDRIIRSGQNYEHVVRYILNNSVAVGLVKEAGEWRDSFYNPKYYFG